MKSNLAERPLVQLTLVRFREFLREPEALFWVFLFPILLAAGLGLAFRNRPAEVLRVGAVTPEVVRALRQEKLLDVQELDYRTAEASLRAGKIALIAEPGVSGITLGGVVYQYDDTNPEGRTARMLADRAVQRAAGRVDPVKSGDLLLREPGSRYIDFLLPGLLGVNIMGSSIWSLAFGVVFHFAFSSPDHISHLPAGEGRGLFVATAVLLVPVEALTAAFGLWSWRRFRKPPV